MHLRRYKPGDAGALAAVYYDAVRNGAGSYTEEQRAAWAPRIPDADEFGARLASMFVMIAEVRGKPIGFMAMQPDGYIDLVFVLHKNRSQGAFRQLYETIETHARGNNLCRLWTHASLMAKPAFAARGFRVIRYERVVRSGQTLDRAGMEKLLF